MPSQRSNSSPETSADDLPLVKISELARMSGVPTPTIKHYMREGLLPGPVKRTSRNMAYYDARLSARVRAIKELQQVHFLPLKVIGDVLEPAPSSQVRADLDEIQRRQLGILEQEFRKGSAGSSGRNPSTGDASGVRTRDDVLASLRISEDDLRRLGEMGLLDGDPPQGPFSGAEREILEIIHQTREQGMGDLFPLEILPEYIDAISALVRMEIDLFRRRVLGGARLPDSGLEQIARQAIGSSERLLVAMRDKMVMRELGAIVGQSAVPVRPGKGERSQQDK